MRRGAKQAVFVAAFLAMISTVSAGIVGGNPVIDRVDQFGGPGAGFSATVHTSVYFGVGSKLPKDPAMYPLADGETAFVYVVVNDGDSGEIDLVSLLNPSAISLPSVGYLKAPVAGLNEADRVKPQFLYAGLDAVQFMFSKATDGVLKPGEWTAVTFRGMGGYQEVTTFVGNIGQGLFDVGVMIGAGPQSFCSSVAARNIVISDCMTGPDGLNDDAEACGCSDFDLDSDIDLSDFGSFQRTYAVAPSDEPTLFGGEPTEERADGFGGAGFAWSANVYTAVYQGVGTELPNDPVLYPLLPGETVLVYLVENDPNSTENIDLLTMLNPDKCLVPMVGSLTMPIDGWDDAKRVLPSLLYGGLDSIQFGFQASQQGEIKPGEWAAMVYRTVGDVKEVTSYVGNLQAFHLDFGVLLGPKTND